MGGKRLGQFPLVDWKCILSVCDRFISLFASRMLAVEV